MTPESAQTPEQPTPPPAGVARALAVQLSLPLSFVLYSVVAAHSHLSLAGLVDAAAFLAFALAGLYAMAAIPKAWLRCAAYMLATFLLILIAIANTVYFRAFNDWIGLGAACQWQDVTPVVGDALASLDWWDWTAGVALPLAAAWLACRGAGTAKRRRSVLLGSALIALVAFRAQPWLCSGSFSPREHDVFMKLLRGFVGTDVMRTEGRERFGRMEAHIWEYFPRPHAGYTTDLDPDYPLLKAPDDSPDPPSMFRIDKSRPPNVVLVLMETVRAFECGAYGAKPSFTPMLDALAAEGMLFRNFYANATQTMRGELALLTSVHPNFTGPPLYSRRPDLAVTSLPAVLQSRGYKTLWISGYTSEYANKKGFLSQHGIEEFHDGDGIPESALQLGWGPSDEAIFEYAERILDRTPRPFFAEIMTLSNHWTFQHPYPTIPNTPKTAEASKYYVGYTRGVYYTDYAVGRFMQQMRKKPYFKNTLFIITTDHGIWLFPESRRLKRAEKTEGYFRMPLILYAPALLPPGAHDVLGSQVDLTPTVLDLLGLRARNAFAGRSLLAPAKGVPRYALMVHTHRWNLRMGNRYLYDMGDEFFEEHFPKPPKGWQPDPRDKHLLLVTDQDLLRLRNPDEVRMGGEHERLRLTKWAEDLIALNTHFVRHGRFCDRPCDSPLRSRPRGNEVLDQP